MTTKKVDFLTKKIECTTPIPFERAWSRKFKNVLLFVSIAPYAEKSWSEGAENGQSAFTNDVACVFVEDQ